MAAAQYSCRISCCASFLAPRWQLHKHTLLNPWNVLLPAEIQREAAQQQGVADAAKLELRNQVAGLMKDLEMQRRQAQVIAS